MTQDMQASIIIGGGPGGMGPLVWAAQTGNLRSWLAQGVSLIDRQDHLGGTLGRYAINSDSLGAAYLECLEAPLAIEALCRLGDEPVVREMQAYRHGFPPLELVDRFMRLIGQAMEQAFAEYPGCTIRHRTTAAALRLQRDGTVEVDLQDELGNRSSMAARTAVMALGGRQQWGRQLWQALRPGLRLADCRLHHMIPSDRLLTPAGLAEVGRVLATDGHRRIIILGGSHSAYSAAWALTRLTDASRLAPAQILILARRRSPVFYPDQEAAEADGYAVTPGDICPRTNRVHRLGGLRGDGRELWRQIAGRPGAAPETRVALQMLDTLPAERLKAMLEDAAVVIPAFGYGAGSLPVFDHRGRRLALQAEHGLAAVDGQGRILRADGRPLAQVFGLGLGSGYRPDGAMGGEPNFRGQANSLWLYQNDIGAMIYHSIQAVLQRPLPIPRRAPASAVARAGRNRPALPVPVPGC